MRKQKLWKRMAAVLTGGTKKIFASAIACILLVSAFSIINAERASAADSAGLEISKAQGSEGDTISVTVSLTRNPGICGLAYKVGFDKDVLKVKNVTASDEAILSDFAEILPDGDGFVGYAFASSKTNSKTGTLLTIEFEILEGAAAGDSSIRFYDYESSDFDGATVNVAAADGSVTVVREETPSAEPSGKDGSDVPAPATVDESGTNTIFLAALWGLSGMTAIAAIRKTTRK